MAARGTPGGRACGWSAGPGRRSLKGSRILFRGWCGWGSGARRLRRIKPVESEPQTAEATVMRKRSRPEARSLEPVVDSGRPDKPALAVGSSGGFGRSRRGTRSRRGDSGRSRRASRSPRPVSGRRAAQASRRSAIDRWRQHARTAWRPAAASAAATPRGSDASALYGSSRPSASPY